VRKQGSKYLRGHFAASRVACRAFSWLAVALAASLANAADHVIHISVDGLRPDYLQTVINSGQAPNFKRFQDEGAWTNNARTDYTHSITLPNHTSMLTGRPVTQPTGLPAQTQHGYTENGDPPATRTLHNFTDPDWYKASTFDVVHDAGFSTALYASKFKFIIYEQSYNAANGAPNATYGSDKIDRFYGPEATSQMQSTMLTELAANHPKYTFLHYADTDDAGHGSGWGSATYMNAIKTIDGYLGQLFNLLTTDATFAGKTAIVLSADHGGTGTGHSDATAATNYTIPFYAWGAGVAHGDIYSFNSGTRTNPGTSRLTYTAAGQPIRNGDGGNLALDLLGLGPVPGSLINYAQDFRVALPGDFNLDNKVDAADYVIYRNGAGTTYAAADYEAWRGAFGQSVGSGAGNGAEAAGVPEPGTALLGVCVLSVAAIMRCGRTTPGQKRQPVGSQCRSFS
jgi:hypothetical protein